MVDLRSTGISKKKKKVGSLFTFNKFLALSSESLQTGLFLSLPSRSTPRKELQMGIKICAAHKRDRAKKGRVFHAPA